MHFIIQTNTIIKSISNNLFDLLTTLGHTCILAYQINKQVIDTYQSSVFIILYPHLIDTTILPKHYIFYQIEQGQHYFDKENFLNLLNGTNHILDCSNYNPTKYSKLIKTLKYVYPTPIPLPKLSKYIDVKKQAEKIYDNTEYDLVFYGTFNERRRKIINYLQNKYKVLVIEHIYNEERDALLQKGKIVINLHYYNDHVLESCRFNETINFDRLIISENSPNDIFNTELYKDIVVLTDCINSDLNNIESFCKHIDYYLDRNNFINKFINNYHKKFNLNFNVSNLFNQHLNIIIKNINLELQNTSKDN